MGFFGKKKISEENIKYIATARALLERCLDVQESEILSKGYSGPQFPDSNLSCTPSQKKSDDEREE